LTSRYVGLAAAAGQSFIICIWTWTSPVVCAGQQLRVENCGPSIVLFFFFGRIQLIRLIQMRIKTKKTERAKRVPEVKPVADVRAK
jgi:hypothetical protein